MIDAYAETFLRGVEGQPTEHLLTLRSMFRAGQINLTVPSEMQTPEVLAWLAICRDKVQEAIEDELERRMN